jgi:hypothetical protein
MTKTREHIASAIARHMLAEAGIPAAAADGTAAEQIALRIGRDIAASCGTYLVINAGSAIMCLRCGAVSHNPNDVAERYCGACNEFLEG